MNKIVKRYLWIGVAIVLAVAALLWAYTPAPIIVETAVVQRREFVRTIEEDGKTRVRERYVVSAPVSGRLLRMPWKAGDIIKHDAEIATLLPTPSGLLDARTRRELQEQFGGAEASVAQAAAEISRVAVILEEKRTDFERATKLLADRFISQAEYDRAQLSVAVAERAVEVAKQQKHVAGHQLDQAKAALSVGEQGRRGKFSVVAPIGGRVLKVMQESEAVVGVGQTLVEIADSNEMEVVVEYLTDDAQLVTPGASATLSRAGLSPLKGVVRLVEPAARTKVSALGIEEQRVNVIIDITSPKEEWGNLGDGFKLAAQVQVEQRANVLTVPVGAVFNYDSGTAVFVVNADSRAKLTPVETGSSSRAYTFIESGVKEGDKVIVYPADNVADGAKVTSQ